MTEAAHVTPATSHPALRLVRSATDALSYSELIDRAQEAERKGRRVHAREFYEAALARLPEARSGAQSSELLRWIARTHIGDGDLDLALECSETALAIAEAHGQVGAVGHAMNSLASIRWQQGSLDEAERLYNVARDRAVEAGEVKLSAMTAQNLGIIANIRGDIQTALAHYELGLATYRQLGMASDVCKTLNNVGLLHTQCERWTEAAACYDEALRLAEVLGDQSRQIVVEVNRAEWSLAQGDYATARRACERAMALVERVRDASALGELHKAFGVVERETGDHASAEHHLGLAHDIAAARQDMLVLADTTRELAELHRRQGRNRDALQCLNRAHRLFAQLRARRELADVDRKLGKLEGDFVDVVRRWGESIECNDEYTQGHCERVASIACALAARDGMDEQSLFWFRIGALLHDVGKLVVPPSVLNKRGKLTENEWVLMRSHTTAGVEMLADVEFPWDVRPIVEGHHERWDGGGYPNALAGDAIPRVARMVCIADVYDALTSERSYKKGMSHAAALEVMRADVGRQFDPALFELFETVAADHAQEWSAPTRALPPERAVPITGATQDDELTGLPLRRAFNEAARAALATREPHESVSLCVIDVDHFKLINDTYGHLQGDGALRGVARMLRANAPAGAVVGRFAGDEFLVLLPHTTLAEALVVAERFRVLAHGIPVAAGRTSPVALTLSIGVASVTRAGVSLEALFAAADAALYSAKRAGRDAVGQPDAPSDGTAPRPQIGAFMARDPERQRLTQLLSQVTQGAPQVVSIIGEAGVGKSSLVRALGSDVRVLGGSLVAGRCADSATRAPYWPWASVISAIRTLRAVPDRTWTALDQLSSSAERQRLPVGSDRLMLFEEVSEFLRLATTSRPFIVVLDDMQWADAASWDLLEYVIARLEHERLLLCLTVREEDADRDVLARRARLSRDERFHEIPVGRLGETELARWLRQAFQQELPEPFVAHLFRKSEGNPFFAVQMLNALVDSQALAWSDGCWSWTARDDAPIPTAVQDLLTRRLSRLSDGAARVLSAVAVVGRSIDLDLAIAAGLATEEELLDAIEEGIAARVLAVSATRGDDRATFTHGLLIERLHLAMHPRRLRRLREQVERVVATWRPAPPQDTTSSVMLPPVNPLLPCSPSGELILHHRPGRA